MLKFDKVQFLERYSSNKILKGKSADPTYLHPIGFDIA
jgi:hypothetical protein